jgi:hypothetical protein
MEPPETKTEPPSILSPSDTDAFTLCPEFDKPPPTLTSALSVLEPVLSLFRN